MERSFPALSCLFSGTGKLFPTREPRRGTSFLARGNETYYRGRPNNITRHFLRATDPRALSLPSFAGREGTFFIPRVKNTSLKLPHFPEQAREMRNSVSGGPKPNHPPTATWHLTVPLSAPANTKQGTLHLAISKQYMNRHKNTRLI